MATAAPARKSREVIDSKSDGATKTSPVPAEVRKKIDQGLEFFLCSFVEMSGLPKAKLVPATHVDDMAATLARGPTAPTSWRSLISGA